MFNVLVEPCTHTQFGIIAIGFHRTFIVHLSLAFAMEYQESSLGFASEPRLKFEAF